eukprot:17238-Heterococcus_DN1.PRE.1
MGQSDAYFYSMAKVQECMCSSASTSSLIQNCAKLGCVPIILPSCISLDHSSPPLHNSICNSSDSNAKQTEIVNLVRALSQCTTLVARSYCATAVQTRELTALLFNLKVPHTRKEAQ